MGKDIDATVDVNVRRCWNAHAKMQMETYQSEKVQERRREAESATTRAKVLKICVKKWQTGIKGSRNPIEN
jgi:hypothetical protein